VSNQVGVNVLYQPTPEQWPNAYYQHCAIVTGWDEGRPARQHAGVS